MSTSQEKIRKATEGTLRRLYKMRKWSARETAIHAMEEGRMAALAELLGELIEMPEAKGNKSMHKILKGIYRICDERLKYLAGKKAANDEERRMRESVTRTLNSIPPGTVTRFEPVGSAKKPIWLMRTLPRDGKGPDSFFLLNSDMHAITRMETALADTLEPGRLYRAFVPSGVIVRYLMAAVVKDEDGEKRVLLQIPEWILRTAAERADKYKEDDSNEVR